MSISIVIPAYKEAENLKILTLLFNKDLNCKVKVKEIPAHFKERKLSKTKRNLTLFIFSYCFTILNLYKIKFFGSN